VLQALENSLVYHPVGADEWEPPPSPAVEDVELSTTAGTRIQGWWLPRRGTNHVALYLHGNSGNLSWCGAAVHEVSEQLDVSVLIIDYPGYGKSGGTPSEAGCYAAADAAYAWLTDKQHVPPDHLLLFGVSLGGGVAVDLGSRLPHRALVLVKTFTSVPDVGKGYYPWLPIHWLMRNRFDSLRKLDCCRQPIFITHGTADNLIPFSHGERLYHAAHEPKHLLRLEGAAHNGDLPPVFFAELRAFLALTAPATSGVCSQR
jgi:fermentation-respiration switch protein FrsA (DUF1100 family)